MVDEASYAKVNLKAPLDKICLLGCGFAIGERNLWCSISHCDDGFIQWLFVDVHDLYKSPF